MRLHERKVATRGWRWWRTGVGLFYVLSAVFNTWFTLPRSGDADTFTGYADGTWFPFLADFMHDVFIPNATAFMAAVIVFEIGVGLLILSHGAWVDLGIAASVGWVLLVLPFLAWPYLIVNFVLLVAQGSVAWRRYDDPAWRPAGRRPAPRETDLRAGIR